MIRVVLDDPERGDRQRKPRASGDDPKEEVDKRVDA